MIVLDSGVLCDFFCGNSMGRYGFPDSIEGLFFHKPVPCHFIDRSDQMISDEYQMNSNVIFGDFFVATERVGMGPLIL